MITERRLVIIHFKNTRLVPLRVDHIVIRCKNRFACNQPPGILPDILSMS